MAKEEIDNHTMEQYLALTQGNQASGVVDRVSPGTADYWDLFKKPLFKGNQTNSGAGFQDTLNAEKAGEEVDLSAAGLSNTAVSPTHGDTSQFHDDPDMPRLEDIIYSNDEDVVGAEADFNNLE
nr:hypothetical protein [Tanacetum cinerariifolium]